MLLAMGSTGLGRLQLEGLVPKNKGILSLRTLVHYHPDCPVPMMVTYSPSIREIDYSQYINMLTDVSLAIRYVRTGKINAILGDYRYVPNFNELREKIKKRFAQTGKPVRVAFDTETLGLDPYNPEKWIISLQMTMEARTCDVVHFPTQGAEQDWFNDPDSVEAFVWIIRSPKVKIIGANAKFDVNWTFARSGYHVENVAFDTLLAGSLLDENRSNALDVHTKLMVPEMAGYSDEFDRTVDKSRMDLVPKERLLPYAGGDADATLRVADVLRKELSLPANKRLTNFYINLLHPAARAYEHVERVGVLVDQDKYRALEADLITVIERCKKEAKKLMGGKIIARYQAKNKNDLEKFNVTTPSLLNDYLFGVDGLKLKPRMFTEKSEEDYKKGKITAGERIPSASLDHVLMFDDVPEAVEFVKVMGEYQSAHKTLTTYVCGRDKEGNITKGFLQHIRADGRFHPAYWLHKGDKDDGEGGTITGRLSARDPAFQTVPAHTTWAQRIRECIIPPDGWLIAGGDYSQGELKVIACVANDHTMIQAYRDGKDLHIKTSSTYHGVSYDEMLSWKKTDPAKYKHMRQDGKAGNFGLIYGMQPDGFVDYAWYSYGVRITRDNAEKFRNTFFELYDRLLPYHEEYQEFARTHGYVVSPLGRVRHLPLINSKNWGVRSKEERRAINSPIQSTLSDLSLLASAESYKRGWHREAPQFGMVHDQNLFYVPADNPEFYCKRQKELMQNLPLEKFGWKPQLQFTVDFTIGPNLADQVEQAW